MPIERLLIPLKLNIMDMIRHIENGCGDICVCTTAEYINEFAEYVQE